MKVVEGKTVYLSSLIKDKDWKIVRLLNRIRYDIVYICIRHKKTGELYEEWVGFKHLRMLLRTERNLCIKELLKENYEEQNNTSV